MVYFVSFFTYSKESSVTACLKQKRAQPMCHVNPLSTFMPVHQVATVVVYPFNEIKFSNSTCDLCSYYCCYFFLFSHRPHIRLFVIRNRGLRMTNQGSVCTTLHTDIYVVPPLVIHRNLSIHIVVQIVKLSINIRSLI